MPLPHDGKSLTMRLPQCDERTERQRELLKQYRSLRAMGADTR